MSGSCWVCLGESEERYHPRCIRELFGTTTAPVIEVELAKLHTLALAMVGHTSLSGIQRKISVGLSRDRTTLQVAIEGGRFILKPEAQTWPRLPENEHVTMRLARLVGIDVPPCGLVKLKEGSLAYVVARFDRLPDGRKLRQEDLCQLAGKSPKEKYEGSAELCGRLVKRYATEPLVELLKLYRLLVFVEWTANGDMHLKNFSLLAGTDGFVRLSPAYDLLSTRLVIPDDQLALPVQGKRDGLGREAWLRFAEHCGLGPKAAERVLDEVSGALAPALDLVGRSLLPEEDKVRYRTLLEERAARLTRGGKAKKKHR